jgi:hypothetical protein
VDEAVVLDGRAGRAQGLGNDVSAEHALPCGGRWLTPPVQVDLDPLEVEKGDKLCD